MLQLFFHTFKLFTWDLIIDLGYWPVWWYTRGLKEFSVFYSRHLKRVWHSQALDILLKNWFKPMYAQTDIQGRIISFFFRTLMILWRAVFFVVWLLSLTALLVVWVTIFPLSIFMIIRILF